MITQGSIERISTVYNCAMAIFSIRAKEYGGEWKHTSNAERAVYYRCAVECMSIANEDDRGWYYAALEHLLRIEHLN